MTKKQQAPERQGVSVRASISVRYKDTKISLSPLQNSVYSHLSDGNRYSSHKLMQRCKTSDPRKEVQYLRRKGINVQDVWVEATPQTPRHKRYFIDPKECGGVRQGNDVD